MVSKEVIRPNLFLIGAMKAGTTSLHSHLQRHPDIFMSEPKEPAFFVPEVERWPKDVDWYLELFADAGEAKVVGEASTHYTKIPDHEGVPERIADFCDDPRFIYVVRDPISRIVSHYWYKVSQGMELRPMKKAVRDDTDFSYKAISDYRRQLEPYFDRFGRDRVLVLTFEELVADPERVLTETYRWLGVDPGRVELELPRENTRAEEVEMRSGLGLLDRFSRSRLWEVIHPYVPSFLTDFGGRMAREKVNPSDVSESELVESLRPEFQEKVRDLESFLERDFHRWTTTFPARERSGTVNSARKET